MNLNIYFMSALTFLHNLLPPLIKGVEVIFTGSWRISFIDLSLPHLKNKNIHITHLQRTTYLIALQWREQTGYLASVTHWDLHVFIMYNVLQQSRLSGTVHGTQLSHGCFSVEMHEAGNYIAHGLCKCSLDLTKVSDPKNPPTQTDCYVKPQRTWQECVPHTNRLVSLLL